uniref:Uncharacterized protein n=1 Tax=Rhizophora mucronata TaxID=61149 RepID=A0A2P2QT55_RHIMU
MMDSMNLFHNTTPKIYINYNHLRNSQETRKKTIYKSFKLAH